MTEKSIVEEAEQTLRVLSAELTEVRPAECLLCYVHRMLDLGCSGLRWAQRYRDERAPRATALEHRLGQMGGFCDCEIFLNAYEPAPELWIRPEPVLEDGVLYDDDPTYPDPLPECRGARRGSTRPCVLWVLRRRW
jgi:hypothetical protein